jgi:hypothetical protein
MNAHPETIAYIRRILERPGMFAADFDLRHIETLLHGFEAGLRAAGVLGARVAFNRECGDFVSIPGWIFRSSTACVAKAPKSIDRCNGWNEKLTPTVAETENDIERSSG